MRVSNDRSSLPSDRTQEEFQRTRRICVLRRRATAMLLMASMALQQACYNYTPVSGAAELPKGLVIIKINERGRMLVGPKLGTLVQRVEGRVVRMDSVNVEVAVSIAEDARGSFARWGGDRFTIPREGMSSMEVKQVSKFRSLLLAGGVVVGLAVTLLAINKSRYGGESIGDGPGNPI